MFKFRGCDIAVVKIENLGFVDSARAAMPAE